jgi:hypothetical protein
MTSYDYALLRKGLTWLGIGTLRQRFMEVSSVAYLRYVRLFMACIEKSIYNLKQASL